MRKMFKMLIALVLVLSTLCSCALAASYSAKVLPSQMNVYVNSGDSLLPAATLSHGTRFKVTAIAGDWAQISYNGHVGYAKMKDIIFDKHIKGITNKDTTIKFITRESYSQNIYYKATLAEGTEVNVVGLRGKYVLITNADDSAIGYVLLSAVDRI